MGIHRLKDLVKKPLLSQEFHVPASRGYGRRKITLKFPGLLKSLAATASACDSKSQTGIRPGYHFKNIIML